MPTYRIDEAHLTVITRAFVSPSPIGGSDALELRAARVPIVTRVVADRSSSPEEAVVSQSNIGKGLVWALAIEGIAALGIYAAWHLWTVLRPHF